jgi:hypothetical protein
MNYVMSLLTGSAPGVDFMPSGWWLCWSSDAILTDKAFEPFKNRVTFVIMNKDNANTHWNLGIIVNHGPPWSDANEKPDFTVYHVDSMGDGSSDVCES